MSVLIMHSFSLLHAKHYETILFIPFPYSIHLLHVHVYVKYPVALLYNTLQYYDWIISVTFSGTLWKLP